MHPPLTFNLIVKCIVTQCLLTVNVVRYLDIFVTLKNKKSFL